MAESSDSDGDHGKRNLEHAAIKGSDAEVEVASVAASWLPTAKPESEITIIPPQLKDNPSLKGQSDMIEAVGRVLRISIKHMHSAEKGKSKSVVGMKTYSLSIMAEVFKLTPKQIIQDEGALVDLKEYLASMIYQTKGIDTRRTKLSINDRKDPDVELLRQIKDTWDLPDNEFGQPFMYKRVNWDRRDFSAGN